MPTMFFANTGPEPPQGSEEELTLCEMLDDPIVAHVMRKDGARAKRRHKAVACGRANENVFVDPTGERIEDGPENHGARRSRWTAELWNQEPFHMIDHASRSFPTAAVGF